MDFKIIATLLLLISAVGAQAQEHNNKTEQLVPAPKKVPAETQAGESGIFRIVSQKAYPTVNLAEFLAKHIRYPKAAKKANIEGRVILEAVVEKDGSISNIRVIRGQELGHGLPEEAIRVLKTTPKWKPAVANGKAVRSYYVVPVTFNL